MQPATLEDRAATFDQENPTGEALVSVRDGPPESTATTGPAQLRFVRILADVSGVGRAQHEAGTKSDGSRGAGATRDRSGPSASPSKARITVMEIFDRAEHAGFGVVIALLAIVSIPLVGLTLPIAGAVAAAGIQMIFRRPRPWLPRFVGQRSVSVTRLQRASVRVERWGRGLVRVVRPRFPWLLRGPGWVVCGIGVTLQGLALGLPVPGADWLFALPLILYGIALLESDGLLILVCHALTAAEAVMAVMLSQIIAGSIADAWRWCAGVLG